VHCHGRGRGYQLAQGKRLVPADALSTKAAVQAALADRPVRKQIVVPGKMVSLVV